MLLSVMYSVAAVCVCVCVRVCVCCKKHSLTHAHTSFLRHPFCPRYVVIIATKFHYSVDVFLGAALSLFVWKFYHSHIRSMWDAQVNKQQHTHTKELLSGVMSGYCQATLHPPTLTTPTSHTTLSHTTLSIYPPTPSPSPHTHHPSTIAPALNPFTKHL